MLKFITGVLTLTRPIPPELGDILNVSVVVMDGGRPALRTEHTVQIEVFGTGVGPSFKQRQYTAEPIGPSQSGKGKFVAHPLAGVEGTLQYSIIDPSSDLFVVNSTSGEVQLSREPFSNEQGREWILNVSATGISRDGGKPPVDFATV
jgi:hypothetical protein